jgi:hypothetical protein
MQQTEEKKHSPIGASSCERWWNCPGSVQLLAQVPPGEGSIYSATGTVAHMMGEIWLRSGIYSDAHMDQYIGQTFVEDGYEIEVTDEMIEAVTVYKNTVWEYLFKYGLRHPIDLAVEVRFALPHVDAEAFGTCDAVVVAPMNRIIIIDYKHGQGHPVEVAHNKQLLYYALGAHYALPEAERSEIAYVETVIVQPRAKHLDGPVRTHVYGIDELRQFESDLTSAVGRVRRGADDLAAGGHCKFCAAKPICPAIREELGRRAELEFSRVEVEPVSLPAPETLKPERLAMLLTNANTIRDWCNSIGELAFALADHGTEIPRYKMVQKAGRRRWINPKDVETAFELEFGDAIFAPKVLKSPAQLEKVLKKRKDELAPYVETPPGGKSLVPVDDMRPEVLNGSEFEVYV